MCSHVIHELYVPFWNGGMGLHLYAFQLLHKLTIEITLYTSPHISINSKEGRKLIAFLNSFSTCFVMWFIVACTWMGWRWMAPLLGNFHCCKMSIFSSFILARVQWGNESLPQLSSLSSMDCGKRKRYVMFLTAFCWFNLLCICVLALRTLKLYPFIKIRKNSWLLFLQLLLFYLFWKIMWVNISDNWLSDFRASK